MIIYWKRLILNLLLSLGTGTLAGLLTMGSAEQYKNLNQPPLSPPSIVFPIVWTILYLLMGIGAYLVGSASAKESDRAAALRSYYVQLAVNFLWPILFFSLKAYLFSFLWIILLWVLVIRMIVLFRRVSPAAAWLQIPYVLWVTFAAYLNLGVYLLNR